MIRTPAPGYHEGERAVLRWADAEDEAARLSLMLDPTSCGSLTRHEMVAAVGRTAPRWGDVPVSVDIEGGYGPDRLDVAEHRHGGDFGVRHGSPGRPACPPPVRRTESAGLPEFAVNARTDVFLFGVCEGDARLGDVLARAAAYAAGRNEFKVGAAR